MDRDGLDPERDFSPEELHPANLPTCVMCGDDVREDDLTDIGRAGEACFWCALHWAREAIGRGEDWDECQRAQGIFQDAASFAGRCMRDIEREDEKRHNAMFPKEKR